MIDLIGKLTREGGLMMLPCAVTSGTTKACLQSEYHRKLAGCVMDLDVLRAARAGPSF